MDQSKQLKDELDSARPNFEEVPDFLKEDDWYNVEVDDTILDFTEPYHPPRWTLAHNGQPFANLGDLHVITGKSGHGKTSMMSIVMAAILCGRVGKLTYELRDSIPKPIVLYIDTEMGKDDTIAIKNRVCELAGLDMTKPQKQFKIARLRDTETAAERWQKILKLLFEIRPTVCFLDGMLDIVEDYNSQSECVPIIRKCMMAATHYDISMWCVLHENPTFDKMVGTLGSVLQRKVTEVFAIRKHKQTDMKGSDRRIDRPQIYFSIEQTKARGRDVASWDFEVTQESDWGMPREIIDQQPTITFSTRHSIDELRQWITDRQDKVEFPASKRDVCELILKPNGIDDETEQRELITMAINRRLLLEQTQDEMKKGQKFPRLKINEQEIKPF